METKLSTKEQYLSDIDAKLCCNIVLQISVKEWFIQLQKSKIVFVF